MAFASNANTNASTHELGPETVREAVRAFGARRPLARAAAGAEPDWKTAEKHVTHLIELIMGQAALAQPDATSTVRRAEDAAVQLLLTLDRQGSLSGCHLSNTQPGWKVPK
ncbi:hypothetical protein [Streptomyces mirabilis]